MIDISPIGEPDDAATGESDPMAERRITSARLANLALLSYSQFVDFEDEPEGFGRDLYASPDVVVTDLLCGLMIGCEMNGANFPKLLADARRKQCMMNPRRLDPDDDEIAYAIPLPTRYDDEPF